MNKEEDYEQTYEEYGRKVLDHFLNPRNVGKMDNPHVMVRVGDPSCGDHIELFVQIKNDTIEEITYLVHGCVGAISTSSALSELAKGQSLTAAREITDDDVVDYLGGIPERKKHCSLLGVKALHAAIEAYQKKEHAS